VIAVPLSFFSTVLYNGNPIDYVVMDCCLNKELKECSDVIYGMTGKLTANSGKPLVKSVLQTG